MTVLAWAVFTILAADPGEAPLVGDQASFVLSALSITDGDLSYDTEDHKRWLELGWVDQPRGLFVQRNEHGWALAKPIGYPVLLAPALAVFGHRGVTIVGALLVIAYAAAWYLACRLRWGTATSAVTAVAATVFSHAWFYAFPAHADLFVAVLTGVVAVGAAYGRVRSDAIPYWLAALAAGVLVTEKMPALLALLPLIIIGGRRLRARDRLVAAGLFSLASAVFIAPYLYYSDGASWSAYGGERYYVVDATPWSGGTIGDLLPASGERFLTPQYAIDSLLNPSEELPAATVQYVFGRHTGVMTFMPVVPLLLAGSCVSLILHRRRPIRPGGPDEHFELDLVPPVMASVGGLGGGVTDSHVVDSGHEPDPLDAVGKEPTIVIEARDLRGHSEPVVDLLAAAVLGLLLYAAFYLVLFTTNYYGGGQSIGSRYFLQFSIVAALVPVSAALSARVALAAAAVAAVWALVVLTPHMDRPHRAFVELWKTTPAQRLLPYDTSQTNHEGLW